MTKPPPRLVVLLELEAWFRPSGSTLKSLFDNLRNYPILAIFSYVLSLIESRSGVLSQVAYWILLPFLLLLAFFTTFQTAMLMSGFFIWFFLGERRQQEQEKCEGVAKASVFQAVQSLLALIFFVAISIACFITVGEIGKVFPRWKA